MRSREQRRCFRCGGQKKLYKTGSAYCSTDTGGAKVDCPLCAGTGTIPSREKLEGILSDSKTNAPPPQISLGDVSAVTVSEVKAKRKSKKISSDKITVCSEPGL